MIKSVYEKKEINRHKPKGSENALVSPTGSIGQTPYGKE
jgi:hypothetical protein